MEATKKSPATSSRWLHSREKELIYNVFQFFSEEKAKCLMFFLDRQIKINKESGRQASQTQRERERERERERNKEEKREGG